MRATAKLALTLPNDGGQDEVKYEFNRSTEPFAKEFIGEHPDWDCDSIEGVSPDAWMIFESATFGTLSKMYKNLRNQSPEASRIANDSNRRYRFWDRDGIKGTTLRKSIGTY